MKRIIACVVSIILLSSLVACKTDKSSPKQAGTGHSNIKLTINGSSDQTSTDNTEENTDTGSQSVGSNVLSTPDIDISTVGTNLIYSKASEIAANYQSYLGKIIKIKGNYKCEKGQGRNYYYCLVSDPTACCSAGFEFVLRDKNAAYPSEDAQFVVQGKLSSYKEGENTYLELIDATIIK